MNKKTLVNFKEEAPRVVARLAAVVELEVVELALQLVFAIPQVVVVLEPEVLLVRVNNQTAFDFCSTIKKLFVLNLLATTSRRTMPKQMVHISLRWLIEIFK